MRKLIICTLAGLALLACETKKEAPMALEYPETAKVDSVDTYFGTDVPDPYRWLEDDRSPETEDWVRRQNALTFSYLEEIPYREELKKRLEQLWNYEKLGTPFKEGGFTYFYKNDGLQDQYVVYRTQGDQPAEVFLDPNTFSEDGTTSLAGLSFSRDGSRAAYSISEGGSERAFRKDRPAQGILPQDRNPPVGRPAGLRGLPRRKAPVYRGQRHGR